MVRRSRRMTLGWCGALMALLLALSPILGLGGGVASAQSSAGAADALLEEARDLAADLDPVDTDRRASLLQQESNNILLHFLNAADDLFADFYLSFTAEAPRDGDDEPFDFGIFFRDVNDAFLNLIWVSNANGGPAWFLFEQNTNVDSGQIDDELFPVEEGSRYAIEIAVIGDEAAFAVNGEAIALLDISNNPEVGRISLSSGIFGSNQIDGDSVEVTRISLFNLDGASGARSDDDPPVDNPPFDTDTSDEDELPDGELPPPPPPDDDEGSGPPTDNGGSTGGDTPTGGRPTTPTASGDQAVSPTYGFTLTVDPDIWTLRSVEATGANYSVLGLSNVDVFDLVDGQTQILIFAGASTDTPEECVERDINFFENVSTRYDFYSIAEDDNGAPIQGPTRSGGGFYAVIWIDDSGPSDNPFDEPRAVTVYIECRPIVEGESMALIEQYAYDEDYNDGIGNRTALLAGLDMSTAGGAPPVDGPDEPVDPIDPVASGGLQDDGSILVIIEPFDDDVDGEAVLTASGSSRTRVDLVSDGAPEGALVVIQEGSCDDLAGEPAFEVGEIDGNGEASGRIRITPEELVGEFALTIVDPDTEDYEFPLACGDIDE